jgi:peptidoglycan/xylan/chitin deacetylase (PgdA/CDA1 family)
MKFALRIEVSTLRGLRQGVPELVQLLRRHGASASFFFNVGPDASGRIARTLLARAAGQTRPRRWIAGQWGARTLLAGTLLPAADLGTVGADAMRSVRDSGHECGLLAWDHAAWQRRAAGAGAAWTQEHLERARQRFGDIFGEPPRAFAAPGGRMNIHAWRLLQRLGFAYGSCTRGTRPFIPLHRAEIIACPQVPVSLPRLDELIGHDGATMATASGRFARLIAESPGTTHVYAARAEFEGVRLLAQFGEILEAARALGYEIVSLSEFLASLDPRGLPRCEVTVGTVAGVAFPMSLQGPEFLGHDAPPLRV